jgi:hypothetical protein
VVFIDDCRFEGGAGTKVSRDRARETGKGESTIQF